MKTKGFLLFDIDGVIRDVTNSYRKSILDTVFELSGWKPSIEDIDKLKSEGCWNNDWDLSMELIKRSPHLKEGLFRYPSRNRVIERFNNFYFGCDPSESSSRWKGYINNEILLVKKSFFKNLNNQGISYGFVSGAEEPSARFVLEKKLGLTSPPLVAMGDAPDKPDPSGFITLCKQICNQPLGKQVAPIGYVGDTVADILTIENAKKEVPDQSFFSIGISPPHLHCSHQIKARKEYEIRLKNTGADYIINKLEEILILSRAIWK